jgi:hypothetical protein
MGAWLLRVGLLLVAVAPLEATTRVTIQDLKEYPERYYGQPVQLECYYDKESPIWVRALPDAEEWIGFFVTGKPDKALTWGGEYYNLLFAPYRMREAVRSLRGGDQITIIGEAFPYQSTSFDGAGIHVQHILQGWGPTARSINFASQNLSTGQNPVPNEATGTQGQPADVTQKYTVTINGKRYEGLRFGDRYTFDGIEFQVEQAK